MGWENSGALFQFLLWNLVQGGQEHGCKMDEEGKGEWRRGTSGLGTRLPIIRLEIHIKLGAIAILPANSLAMNL